MSSKIDLNNDYKELSTNNYNNESKQLNTNNYNNENKKWWKLLMFFLVVLLIGVITFLFIFF